MDSLNVTKLLFIVLALVFVALVAKGLFPKGEYGRAQSEMIGFGILGLVFLTIASASVYGT